MTNSKGTKAAIVTSIISVMLCAVMLVGTTYAWFTDSVSAANNIISAGNLDIELEYLDGEGNWEPVTASTNLFMEGAAWEPGHTEVIYLKIVNAGTLALEYKLGINIVNEIGSVNMAGEEFKLSDYIKMGIVEDRSTKYGSRSEALNALDEVTGTIGAVDYSRIRTLEPGDNAVYLALVVYFPKEVGNEVNYAVGATPPSITLGITLNANQVVYETDGFPDPYDVDAELEKIVDSGTCGGVKWTLTNKGKMTVSPGEDYYDETNGRTYKSGEWREIVSYNNGSVAMGEYPYDENAVKSLVIEEGVTYIGSFVAKFPNLTGEVIIPASVSYIGQEAFQNTKITKLTFAEGGDDILCIAPGALKKIHAEEIIFPADRPEIHLHSWILNDCLELKRITFPKNTKFMGQTHLDYYISSRK